MTWVFVLMRWMALLAIVGLIAACGTLSSSDKQVPETSSSLAWPIHSTRADAAGASALWRHHTFPTKRSTRYQLQQIDGRQALHSQANSAASMLQNSLRVEAYALGGSSFRGRFLR